MKKLLITTTLIGSLISSIASAENKNQFSISIINSKIENDYKSTTLNQPTAYDSDGSSISFALNYGYKIELPNNLFVTPGVFYDNINNLAKESSPADKEKINYRYGLKADLGYNVLDNLAVFGSLGLATVKYDIDWQSNNPFSKSGDDTSLVYGAGLSYDVTKDIFVTAEYNFQSVELEANTSTNNQHYDSDIEVFKLGIGYQF